MKKKNLLALLLALCMCFALTACSKDKGKDAADSDMEYVKDKGTLVKDTSLARIISFQEVIWAGYAFLKGSHGYSGLVWPLFFTGVYYLIFVGVMTLVFGWIERKLNYFR